MVNTGGFAREHRDGLVRQSRVATHYFEDISFREFVSHERRMITGTVINCWIFEDLLAQRLTAHGGETVRRANQDRPDWVQSIIDRHVTGKRWVVPPASWARVASRAASRSPPRRLSSACHPCCAPTRC